MTDEPVTPRDETPKKGGWGCLWLAVLVIGVPAACTAIASSSGQGSWEPTSREATAVCEDWVREKLKAPSSAEFSGATASGYGAGPYTVSGKVDAQNSFGALIRSSWTCTIEYRASDEKWHGSASLLD
ncbi:hypothetical protein [Cellulomonas palmilytica]|uniref:hypothetical protein n=1 Tax=Cellulomonas palmilytica TaxID=2608402 RepID=UPI001F26F0BF|nr:hypothetical protein [Cellulomonas palmilytica]UJP39325.1 hypothetical protein F1D97_13395 [Cellulomonas palmilytica]